MVRRRALLQEFLRLGRGDRWKEGFGGSLLLRVTLVGLLLQVAERFQQRLPQHRVDAHGRCLQLIVPRRWHVRVDQGDSQCTHENAPQVLRGKRNKMRFVFHGEKNQKKTWNVCRDDNKKTKRWRKKSALKMCESETIPR